jgi:hypothetical protein
MVGMSFATIFSRVTMLAMVTACSNSPVGQNDASTSDAANDSPQQQEASVVTCSAPGACPTGGVCFFAVGDCTATTGICSDDSACDGGSTETMCFCDGSENPVAQCGPGGYATVKAASFGPCPLDASTD